MLVRRRCLAVEWRGKEGRIYILKSRNNDNNILYEFHSNQPTGDVIVTTNDMNMYLSSAPS